MKGKERRKGKKEKFKKEIKTKKLVERIDRENTFKFRRRIERQKKRGRE